MIFGSDLSLTDKWGPLPVWAYVVGAGGVVGFVLWRRSRSGGVESSDASGYVDVGQIAYPEATDPAPLSNPSGDREDDEPYVIPGIGVVTGPGQVFNPFPKAPEQAPAGNPDKQPGPPPPGTYPDPPPPPFKVPPIGPMPIPATLTPIIERRYYQAIGDDSDIYYIEKGQKRLTVGRPFNLPFERVSRESLGPIPLGDTIRVQDLPN